MTSNGLIVKVVKVPAKTLVKDCGSADSKCAVWADGPTASVDGASLWRIVELKLSVGDNGSNTLLGVQKDSVVECQDKNAFSSTSGDTL